MAVDGGERSDLEISPDGLHWLDITLALFYCTIFLVSVPANAVALWAFCHAKSGASVTRVFLKNLALADMCYVLLLPMRVIHHVAPGDWVLGEVACRLSGFLFYLNLYCSLYFVTSVGFDRFLAVVLPIRSRSWRKTGRARVTCGIIWVTVTICMVPVLLSKHAIHTGRRNTTVCHQLYLEEPSPKALVSMVAAFAVPLVVLCLSYFLILVKLRVTKNRALSPTRTKAKRTVILTLLNFLVAFLPYHTHRFFYIIRHNQSNSTEVELASLAVGNQVTSALTCVNGIIDPLLYFFLTETYRRTLLGLLGKRGRIEVDQRPGPGPDTSSAFPSSCQPPTNT